MKLDIRKMNANMINDWLTEKHYLHRPVIRSKLLGYGIFENNLLVGAVLWSTVHFTKMTNLFGITKYVPKDSEEHLVIRGESLGKETWVHTYNTDGEWRVVDKWEVLMLARFYLTPDYSAIASEVMKEVIGPRIVMGPRRRRKRQITVSPRGWRLQQDWCFDHPPRYIEQPFVPRLLISWSDGALPNIENCPKCGAHHRGYHKGVIYQAAGWQKFGVPTKSSRRRTNNLNDAAEIPEGNKQCWILPLDMSNVAKEIGIQQWKARHPPSILNLLDSYITV